MRYELLRNRIKSHATKIERRVTSVDLVVECARVLLDVEREWSLHSVQLHELDAAAIRVLRERALANLCTSCELLTPRFARPR